jgi:hypothetical protein
MFATRGLNINLSAIELIGHLQFDSQFATARRFDIPLYAMDLIYRH